MGELENQRLRKAVQGRALIVPVTIATLCRRSVPKLVGHFYATLSGGAEFRNRCMSSICLEVPVFANKAMCSPVCCVFTRPWGLTHTCQY